MIISRSHAHNNFTILRLALAWLVFVGHYKMLSGGHDRYADVAVDGFFIVSGYLITSSFDADSDLRRFFIRRIFRLYPLYLVVVLAQAAAMAYVAPGALHQVMNETLRYVLANAAFLNFLQPDIGNVLAGLKIQAINPSLWTLKIEMGFYIVLPFLWMLVRRQGNWVLAAIFALSAIYSFVLIHAGFPVLAKQLPGQMQYFVLGMAIYRYRDKLMEARTWQEYLLWGGTMVAAFAYAVSEIRTPLLYPLAMAVLMFGIACRTWPLNLRLDISYGVYLAHAPVIQTALLLGWFRNDFVGLFAAALVVVVIALFAERAVERPFIAIGKRLSLREMASSTAVARV